MTSSLLYAWVRSNIPPARAFSQDYVPVINIPKADISLRPEFATVLGYGGLNPSDLISLDELKPSSDATQTLKPKNTKLILVDHNALHGQLGGVYAQRIGGVIDHHDEEHKVREDTGPEPRIVETAGSCTSLVTNFLTENWDNLSRLNTASEDCSSSDAEMAKMALSSILIDTANMTASSKVTAHDEKAVQYLEAKIRADPEFAKGYDRQRLYQEVSSAKEDIGRLCINDILRKDYKEWEEGGKRLGISTVVKPLRFLIQKAKEERSSDGEEDLATSLDEFCKQRHLELYGIMTAFTDEHEEFNRELLLRSMNQASDAAAEHFERNASQELGLSVMDRLKLGSGKSTWQKNWKQAQVQHSRKRIAPLLREAMG